MKIYLNNCVKLFRVQKYTPFLLKQLVKLGESWNER